MNDPLAVCFIKRVGDLDADVYDLLDWQWSAVDPGRECLAFDIFHRNEVDVLGFANFINCCHMWMVQGARGFGLAHKATQTFGIGGDVSGQYFQGYSAVELGIARLINFAHSPFA